MIVDVGLMQIAQQAARSYYRKHNYHDYDEIEAEAYLAMLEAVLSYDPSKERSQKSWVGFIVNRTLNKKFWNNTTFVDLDPELLPATLNPEQICAEYEKHQNLSSLSQHVMKMICRGELKPKNDKQNWMKVAIKEKLRKQGIPWHQIRAAFSELKEAATA